MFGYFDLEKDDDVADKKKLPEDKLNGLKVPAGDYVIITCPFVRIIKGVTNYWNALTEVAFHCKATFKESVIPLNPNGLLSDHSKYLDNTRLYMSLLLMPMHYGDVQSTCTEYENNIISL